MMWTYVWYISQPWMISNIDLDKYMQCLALLKYEKYKCKLIVMFIRYANAIWWGTSRVSIASLTDMHFIFLSNMGRNFIVDNSFSVRCLLFSLIQKSSCSGRIIYISFIIYIKREIVMVNVEVHHCN